MAGTRRVARPPAGIVYNILAGRLESPERFASLVINPGGVILSSAGGRNHRSVHEVVYNDP